MALKALLLRKKIDDAKRQLDQLRAKDADLDKREAELAASVAEVTDETTAEEREALESMVDEFDNEKNQHEADKDSLERKISELESELADEEKKQDVEPAPVEERKDEMKLETRNKIFGKMDVAERTAFVESIKDYLGEVRTAIKEKRALTNIGLTIPEVMLGLLRENIMEYSKLYKHVNVRQLNGEGRLVIMGTIPEAIWTDCCANLNELSLKFNDASVDCYRLGGYFAVCNANLEDSDLDLAGELMTALGQAIGLALDKAILFGRNGDAQAMPMGIVTRLAQTSQPAGYPATARTWEDLHVSNVKTISSGTTGKDLFAAIAIDAAAAKGKYSRGEKVWVMNETTYAYLVSQAMSFDANGAIVSGVNGVMPVIGGIIEVLDFVPDYVIVGGYFDLYLLAERKGPQFAQSEHVKFLADQTVFKGTARYDGLPVIAEGFVAIGVNSTSVNAAAVSFDADTANVPYIRLNADAATVAVGGKLQLIADVPAGTSSIAWVSATTGKATIDSNGVVTGVATGSSVITATANGLTASCTVTVTAE